MCFCDPHCRTPCCGSEECHRIMLTETGEKDCPWCAFKKSANTTHFDEKSEVRDNFADWLSGRLKRYYNCPRHSEKK